MLYVCYPNYTLSCTYGILQLASQRMVSTFQLVKQIVSEHIANSNHIFLCETFANVVTKIANINVLKSTCDEHPEVSPYLILSKQL